MSRRPNDLIGLPNRFEETAMPLPYPEGLAGAYLDFKDLQIDKGVTMRTEGLTDENGLLPHQTTARTADVYAGKRTKNEADAILMERVDPEWTFTFLKYVPGAVTIAPLTGPILTGPMSGCLLCKYTHDGQQSLAHIGTADTPQDPRTKAVKDDWKAFINSATGAHAFSVTGFDPAKCFDRDEIAAQMFDKESGFGRIPVVVGYFDNGSAYAMLLAPLPPKWNTRNSWLWRVVGITPQETLKPWSELASSGGWQ
jgi:hypothetical protein